MVMLNWFQHLAKACITSIISNFITMTREKVPEEKAKEFSKKDLERTQLINFVSNKELGIPVIDIINNETPDFIVKSTKKQLSVEVTQLIYPKIKMQEAFQNNIVKDAEQLFLEKYDVMLQVYVTFRSYGLNASKTHSIKYSQQIFEIVERIYISNQEFEFNVSSRNKRRPFNSFIDSITIKNDFNFSGWQPFGAYKVDKIDEEWLMKKIASKGEKIKKYEKTFDENWLLLISSLGHKSSAHDFAFMNIKPIPSLFDRIYIYEYMQDRIIKLPIIQ